MSPAPEEPPKVAGNLQRAYTTLYERSRRYSSASLNFKLFSRSDYRHVFGTRAFLALGFRERHSLTFLEIIEAHTFETRVVEEQIFVPANVDKSKAFVRQFLNRTLSHFVQLSKKFSAVLPETNVLRPCHHRPQLYRKDSLLQSGASSREDHGASFVFRAMNFSLVRKTYHASFTDK